MLLRKLLLVAGIIIWGLAIAGGVFMLITYSARPGDEAQSPANLPAELLTFRQRTLPTLLVFAHPQCPCTRATMAELARLIAHNHGRVNVQVLFYRPWDKPREWVEADLWQQAARLPTVQVLGISEIDLHRFGVTTSGQTLLYDAAGKLVFSGGITRARGHEGDSAGRTAITEFLHHQKLPLTQTPVFGCSILDAE
jgi:hypothetical protein